VSKIGFSTASFAAKKWHVETEKAKRYHRGMNSTAEQVMTEALGLSPSLRAFVAERLIESLDIPDAAPLSAKWKEEVRGRCAELDRGTVVLRTADQVFATAYAALT